MEQLRKLRCVLLGLLLAALLAAVAVPAFAAEEASAIRLVRTEGTVAVTDGSGKEATLRQNMRLYSGYRVSTGEDGYAWVSLDDTKAVKLDLDSSVEIRQSGKKLELLLEKGELFFDVSAPLAQDETLNIRTSNMVTGIRGTSGWAEVLSRSHSRLCLLEGVVTVVVTDAVTGQEKSATLQSGDMAELVVYDEAVDEEQCDILMNGMTLDDIPSAVLEVLLEEPELVERIIELGGLDLSGLTPEIVEQKRAEEQTQLNEELDDIQTQLKEQDKSSKQDLVYTGEGAQVQKSWTISWYDDKGTLLSTSTVVDGVTPSHDALANKDDGEGGILVFTGWTPTPTAATANTSYTAKFSPGVTVTWYGADEEVLETKVVAQGTTPTYSGAAPTKDSEEDGVSYAFSAWEREEGSSEDEINYWPTFTTSYRIRWFDGEKKLLSETTAAEGTTPTAPSVTQQYEDGNFLCTFDHWEPTLSAAEAPQDYSAIYERERQYWTITWLNEDETLIEETRVRPGELPSHADPEMDDTEQYHYEFSKWNPAIVAADSDATYTAEYDRETRWYLITWKNDTGETLAAEERAYGTSAAINTPEKDETDEYTYKFAGWEPELAPVTGEATYTATYTASKRKYVITWMYGDGFDTTEVEYGELPTHEDPTGLDDDDQLYDFNGWSPTPVAVTGTATYSAQLLPCYYVHWCDGDGEEYETTRVRQGETPTYPGDTSAFGWELEDGLRYGFTGWNETPGPIYQEKWYLAQTDVTAYRIRWYIGDDCTETWVAAGAMPQPPSVQLPQDTAEYSYSFSGWSPQIVTANDPAEYSGSIEAQKRSYTITWKDDNGNTVGTTTVEYGQVPSFDPPDKQETDEYTYKFSGWNPEVSSVTGEATYTASYMSIRKEEEHIIIG